MLNNGLVIVDYKMGNLRSVQKAFEKIGCKAIISSDKETILKANKLVLPGVGAFKDGMKYLKELNLLSILNKKVLEEKIPILGICLGMQLLSNKSYENGETDGLGWIDAEVLKFDFSTQKLKVPHIGWNELNYKKNCSLFENIENNSDFYFVHSYHFKTNENIVIGTTNYGFEFVSAINKDNIYAVQFHPEKSQIVGLQLIENFVNL
ncbi:imidazole glycerol phosphate synthase subunit HisH [Aliarcobacter butzleri]|uniref:imidazole glycerol phosphate synthase subunit HisH n=1 Tax=Aliarcobacter butzleri TaxID=28197 RepID=UPI00263E58D1|nr:imidazole glycerol phosphate synthase subunit HisH [Aliarcobacter butzleri]MDN5126624.1 imidazole glycerol phosphate synthase subunit HisH [Aliarcobacter butzleri]